MMYISMLLGLGFVFWVIGVSSNVSVYYGVVNLVFAAVMGCGVIVWKGGSFLSLVLFLIYLGGMLVIFSYSATLVLEPFPAALANWEGVIHILNYGLLIGVLLLIGWDLWGIEGFGEGTVDADGLSVVRVDFMGLSLLYGGGWGVLFAAGIGLLLTFFVVLVLVRGLYSVTCRAI
uniref:NADH-ubiquinone oxidoreductase chain 6 n=1 Tax=Podocnemis expansa TaxID=44507 RepID=A0A343L9X9_PODEX|nr:NADH dehydrogenase subunit 6 [Podocnemis expansa]DBA36340.1 TPA_inf: NADH dehydrogenase subunit 6 [Podocnemis expansa]